MPPLRTVSNNAVDVETRHVGDERVLKAQKERMGKNKIKISGLAGIIGRVSCQDFDWGDVRLIEELNRPHHFSNGKPLKNHWGSSRKNIAPDKVPPQYLMSDQVPLVKINPVKQFELP